MPTAGALASSATRRGSPAAAASVRSDSRCQRPALSMPTSTGSNRVRSSADSTLRADNSEISCSADRPPNRMMTRVFFMAPWS
jgi:hypothetical protein